MRVPFEEASSPRLDCSKHTDPGTRQIQAIPVGVLGSRPTRMASPRAQPSIEGRLKTMIAIWQKAAAFGRPSKATGSITVYANTSSQHSGLGEAPRSLRIFDVRALPESHTKSFRYVPTEQVPIPPPS